jgi:redox-sensitive bicupin YhaK (pirin superfamily)
VSGPVRSEDAAAEPGRDAPPPAPTVEVTESREAEVGGHRVRRALPRRARRTVGAWCFADHLGPERGPTAGMDIGPHPHIGLQTVTWLLEGEVLHRDSVGSEQPVRPGQLNLMTAGHGVSHAEESTHRVDAVHGIQLWVAQPESTRHDAPAFEHHASLPQLDVDDAVATVLVGELGDAASPARRDTDHLGVDLDLRPGRARLPLRAGHEHAVVVLSGALTIGPSGDRVTPGHLAYLGLRRDELELTATEPTRALLLGGEPFEAPVLMWWNFVARTRDEVDEARADWAASAARFGETASGLDRIPAPAVPWAGPTTTPA